MKILIAYASKYGSTQGIADFIGKKLEGRGFSVDVSPVQAVKNVRGYQAFIVGSAAFMGRWMKEAKEFVTKNQRALSAHPIWLFSSGPVGKEKKDAKGQDVLELSKPEEFRELSPLVHPVDCKVFFGALFADKITGLPGMIFRLTRKMKAARENMPEGDFRDWKEIESWTQGVAEKLGG